jgi:hypothetical protein
MVNINIRWEKTGKYMYTFLILYMDEMNFLMLLQSPLDKHQWNLQ